MFTWVGASKSRARLSRMGTDVDLCTDYTSGYNVLDSGSEVKGLESAADEFVKFSGP